MTVLAVSLKLPVKETSPPSKTVTGVEGAPHTPPHTQSHHRFLTLLGLPRRTGVATSGRLQERRGGLREWRPRGQRHGDDALGAACSGGVDGVARGRLAEFRRAARPVAGPAGAGAEEAARGGAPKGGAVRRAEPGRADQAPAPGRGARPARRRQPLPVPRRIGLGRGARRARRIDGAARSTPGPRRARRRQTQLPGRLQLLPRALGQALGQWAVAQGQLFQRHLVEHALRQRAQPCASNQAQRLELAHPVEHALWQ